MKKIIITFITVFIIVNVYSQEKDQFRVGLDLGYTLPSDGGGGFLISIEPKYNIQDNMNVGLRMGAAAMIRDFNTYGNNQSAKKSLNLSYVATYIATYDYYFNNSGDSFVPYIGGGVGFYTIANVKFDSLNSSDDTISFAYNSKFGGLIRGGFEYGKFRMGVEYNLIPKSTLQNISGDLIGTIANNYVGIHLGFFVGGGRWGK